MLKRILVTSFEISRSKAIMTSREVASKKKANRSEYENFKPLMLPDFTGKIENIQPSQGRINKTDEGCVYETLPVEGEHQATVRGQKSADKKDVQNNLREANRRQQDFASPGPPHLKNKEFVAEAADLIKDGSKIIREPKTDIKPQTKQQHSKHSAHADTFCPYPYGLQGERRIPSTTVAGTPGIIKQRPFSCSQPRIDIKNSDVDSAPLVYENMLKGRNQEIATKSKTLPQVAPHKKNEDAQCYAIQKEGISRAQSNGRNRETMHDDNSLVYENIPLKLSTDIKKGMTKSSTFPTMTAGIDNHNLHDPVVPDQLSPLRRDGTNFVFLKTRQPEVKQYSEKTTTQKAGKMQLVSPDRIKPPVSVKPIMKSPDKNLQAQDIPQKTQNAKKDRLCDGVKEHEVEKDCTESTILSDFDVKIQSRMITKETSKFSPIQSSQITTGVSYDRHLQNKPSQLEQQGHSLEAKPINVKQMKVNELSVWMKEKLRLGKYVSHFAEEMIDGSILMDMDEEMLITSFGFSVLEAKRLRKFAQEGHVPT